MRDCRYCGPVAVDGRAPWVEHLLSEQHLQMLRLDVELDAAIPDHPSLYFRPPADQ